MDILGAELASMVGATALVFAPGIAGAYASRRFPLYCLVADIAYALTLLDAKWFGFRTRK